MGSAPMRLIDRYICREVVSHAILGLTVFTFVFFVPQLVRLMELIVRHTAGSGSIALLFLCTIPPVLAFTLPMAVLVGVLIGLGRLSADSEIVAIHASGISLRRLLLPIGCVAVVTGVLTLATTFWLGPASLRTLERLELRLLASQAPFSVQPRVFDERFPHFVLYVQDVEAAATRWRGVFLASQNASGSGPSAGAANAAGLSVVTVAKDAQVVIGGPAGQAELHLGAGSEHEYDPHYRERYNVTTFGESDIPVQISTTAVPQKNMALTVSERSVRQLLADKDRTQPKLAWSSRGASPSLLLAWCLRSLECRSACALAAEAAPRPDPGAGADRRLLLPVCLRRPHRRTRPHRPLDRCVGRQHRRPGCGVGVLLSHREHPQTEPHSGVDRIAPARLGERRKGGSWRGARR